MMYSTQERGFTLIELTIVISIIGTLSTIVLGSLQRARFQANDSKRVQEIVQMQTALELYYNDNGQYPESDRVLSGQWDVPSDGTFLGVLAAGNYMPNIHDPRSDWNALGNYEYFRYPAGTYGCDVNKGAYYVLIIGQFESTAPRNPGFSCPGRNWTVEGAYVVGKFENG